MAFLQTLSIYLIPLLLVTILVFAAIKRVPLYASFTTGAEEGFMTAVRMIPHVVAMMVAIAIFRASGALEGVVAMFTPLLHMLSIPAPVFPLAFLRSLTGAGSLAYTIDLIKQYGADSLFARMATTIQASSDTTLYVLAVYFGAVGITKSRYALPVGLLADVIGFLASVWVCLYVFGDLNTGG